MSEEERLPEERWRRVGVSGSLRGKRSEEMTQSNTSSPRGSEVPLDSQKGVMAIKVPKNEEIFGGEKNGGRKGVGFAISWGGANRGTYTLRKESKEELLREMLPPT